MFGVVRVGIKNQKLTNQDSAFTLLEIVIVIVIIGILGTLAVNQFGPVKERALDNEAKANLKLIQAAEKIYKMETGSYYPASGSDTNIATINSNLKLSLTEANWDYLTKSSGCAQATRSGRTWNLTIGDADGEPNSGTCP